MKNSNKKIGSIVVTSLAWLCVFAVSFSITTVFCLKFLDYENIFEPAPLEMQNPDLNIQEKIKKGDVEAYRHYVDSCLNDNSHRFVRYLPYSILMADSFEYVPAYYDAYRGITEMYKADTSVVMSDETKALSLFFLRCGAFLGDSASVSEMKRLNLPISKILPAESEITQLSLQRNPIK